MEDYLNQDYEEFCVNRYDMELQVDDVLSAHVVCVREQKDLPQYQFTLYHGYKISSVTNEKGEKTAVGFQATNKALQIMKFLNRNTEVRQVLV